MRPHRRAVPRLCLTALLLAGAMPAGGPAARAEEPRVIEVVASRFAFKPSVIEATVGERLRLVIRSADGVHGFGLRSFNVQRTIPRGDSPVIVDLTPSMAGRFSFLCTEYCGAGHDDMRGTLVVHASGATQESDE